MSKQFDTLVYIGRFQPFHLGHLFTLKRGLLVSNRVVVVLGSCGSPRTQHNPFLPEERTNMIPLMNEVRVVWGHDKPSNQEWVEHIKSITSRHIIKDGKTGLLGHRKDSSSFYLDLFPEWELMDPGGAPLNATDVRKLYFGDLDSHWPVLVPDLTEDFLWEFAETQDYLNVKEMFDAAT